MTADRSTDTAGNLTMADTSLPDYRAATEQRTNATSQNRFSGSSRRCETRYPRGPVLRNSVHDHIRDHTLASERAVAAGGSTHTGCASTDWWR
ncbi:hypothetical protein Atai01_05600 [Amycolatopsis taiwanensis]|uniref:Uncharacterized protein n=1 Tax=Amycolatopsis taiwanensis TaxID=342230 RepID=A0A9W6QTW0_9PSEU|nr:hypothetical protein Atai01_05600 [Amycolatopsis taiwanensis]